MSLAYCECSLMSLSCLCHRAPQASGRPIPAGTSVHPSRAWDGASSAQEIAWLSQCRASCDSLRQISVPTGLPSRVAATQPSFGIGPCSPKAFSVHPQDTDPRAVALIITPSLLPTQEDRGGQRRGLQVVGDTQSTPLPLLGWDPGTPRAITKRYPSPELKDKSLFSQNMAEIEQDFNHPCKRGLLQCCGHTPEDAGSSLLPPASSKHWLQPEI